VDAFDGLFLQGSDASGNTGLIDLIWFMILDVVLVRKWICVGTAFQSISYPQPSGLTQCML
jgi:hypothetical protein